MKTLAVQVAEEPLSHLISAARREDIIVLTDGARSMTLDAGPRESGALDLDLEMDSPQLATKLLKAAKGPFKPYSPEEMRVICERIVQGNPVKKPVYPCLRQS